MIGIGFFELLVIAVLGLLVFGPEKLPQAIRTFAFGFSKAKRSWQNTRRELEQELGMDEIRREIHNAHILENIEKTKKMGGMEESENNIGDYQYSEALANASEETVSAPEKIETSNTNESTSNDKQSD